GAGHRRRRGGDGMTGPDNRPDNKTVNGTAAKAAPERIATERIAPDRIAPDWIAVDWGTSNLRVTAMGAEGPLATRGSDQGMAQLAPEGFEPALLALISDWLPATGRMPVMICGMAGARQG